MCSLYNHTRNRKNVGTETQLLACKIRMMSFKSQSPLDCGEVIWRSIYADEL